MKRNLRTFFVNSTFKMRMRFDRLLYLFFRSFNHWEILDQYKGKDVLIVGNGPSLKRTELDRINMVSIGMNKINLLFDKTSWRPDIIVCDNGYVIRQNRKFFNKTKIILILPARAWYLGVRKRKNVLYYGQEDMAVFCDFEPKSKGFYGATVTYTALKVAARLAPVSINIVGVDHSFKKNVENGSGVERFKGDDDNHFDPNYFKGKLWGLPDIEGSEVAYNVARSYFDAHDIPIVDYTIDGQCPCFVRGDIKAIYR